jgi:hypothetical protein
MFRLFLVFFLLFLSGTFINYAIGQGGVPFPVLLNSPDARFSGMGEAGSAMNTCITATYLNPAGLGFLKTTQFPKHVVPGKAGGFSTTYFEVAENISSYPLLENSGKLFSNTVAGVNIKSFGFLAIDFRLGIYGEQNRIAENGQILGKYNSSESCIGLAYGKSIGEDWGVGAKVKYLSSNIAPAPTNPNYQMDGRGLMFDAGVLWNPSLGLDSASFIDNKGLSVGLSFQNLGGEIEYINESEPSPSLVRLGGALKMNISHVTTLSLATDWVHPMYDRESLNDSSDSNFGLSMGNGTELWYKDKFAARLGYYFESECFGGRKYWTVGASYKLYIFQLDLSYNMASGYSRYTANMFRVNVHFGGNG